MDAAAAAAAAMVAGYIFTGALALPDRVLPSRGMVTPRRLVVLMVLQGGEGGVKEVASRIVVRGCEERGWEEKGHVRVAMQESVMTAVALFTYRNIHKYS